MQSTPLWFTAAIAFVAPAIAFVGVWLGVRVQRKNAELQLAAQRERDQALWAREDRHRFTEQKRILYAEFITHVTHYWVTLKQIRLEIKSQRKVWDEPTRAQHREIISEGAYVSAWQEIH